MLDTAVPHILARGPDSPTMHPPQDPPAMIFFQSLVCTNEEK